METVLAVQSALVFGLGTIVVLVIGLSLGGYLVSGPPRTHRAHMPLTARPDYRPTVFTAHNVILDHSYVILDREKCGEPTFVQEFRIQDRRMDYFLIRVHSWGEPYTNRGQTFEGWTAKIQADRPIRPEDLLAACPI